jgi:plasmid replication initiation protein
VYAEDGGSVRLVKTGDFTDDGYGDIFFVTADGKPVLFNNVEKDFVRQDLSAQMSLSGSIIQAEVFDMDSDGRDDITTLDDAGEIHIFYGG